MNYFKNKLMLSFVFSFFAICELEAQNVAINGSGVAANLSAILDLDGVTGFVGPNGYKGLLIPRMTLAQRTGIVTLPVAAQGLFVYQTDGVQGFYYNTSITTAPTWVYLTTSNDWALAGNTGTTPGTDFLGTTDAQALLFRTNNIDRIRIMTDVSTITRVGIGTNFPTSLPAGSTPTLLHMHDAGATATDFAQLTLSTAHTTATNKIGEMSFAVTAVAAADRRTASIESYLTAVSGVPNVSGDLRFFTNNSVSATFTEKMRIQGNGRVGIGTTAPAGQLDVVIASGSPTALFSNYGNVNEIYFQRAQGTFVAPTIIGSGGVLGRLLAKGYDGAVFQDAAQIAYEVDGTSAAGDMPGRITFSTTLDGTAVLAERMRIDNTGYVGIGITVPVAKLDVRNAAAVNTISSIHTAGTNYAGYFQVNNAANNFNAIYATTNGSGASINASNTYAGGNLIRDGIYSTTTGVGAAGTTNKAAYFSASGAANNYAAIFDLGNVGVGSLAPTQKLDVTGNIRFSGALMPNNLAGTAGQVLTSAGAGLPPTWAAAGAGSDWGLTGNAGTSAVTNFVGTTDAVSLNFRVNNLKAGKVEMTGPTFFGYRAGNINTDVRATAVGYNALLVNTTGSFNTAIGYEALLATTGVSPNGSANTGLGAWTLHDNTSGGQNTAVGTNAMYSNVNGMGNTALGYQAMYFCGACAFSNNMVLGADVGIFMTPTASNQVWVGDNGVTSIRGQVAFTVYSDERVKKNVVENIPGLAFINELRAVSYNYDYNKEVELKGGIKTPDWEGKYDIEKIKFSGFIAQEVEAAAIKIGYDFSGVDKPKSEKDIYGLRYSEFVVPLVKAVQELDQEKEELKAKVEILFADNLAMRAELDKIKVLLEANNKQ